jgi:hypothetical protein
VSSVPQQAPKAAHGERWQDFDSLRSLSLVSPTAVPSDNHEPFRWNMLVRVTPAALQAYLDWRQGDTLPEGTLLVAQHFDRKGATPGPFYFSKKTANGWQFGAASADGWLLPTNDACALCHSEAPADHVFGLGSLVTSPNETQRPDGG